MNPKEFEPWFKKKPVIDRQNHRPFVHEREVWWCYLGTNIGSEQDGMGANVSRPVVIFRRFNRKLSWVLPLTTSLHDNALHIEISLGDDMRRQALVTQLRCIDSKRLGSKIGTVTKESFEKLSYTVEQIAGSQWNHKRSPAASKGATGEAEASDNSVALS